MSGPPPDLSVVLVTHNGREMALQTLESALGAAGGIELEWILVDNASTDGTPEAVGRRFPAVTVLRRPNLGFAAGNNAALARARGRHVLLLNPDVEIREGTLADLVAALDERPEVGAASVAQLDPAGDVFPSAWRFPTAARQVGEALFARRWPLGTSLQEAYVDPGFYETERSVDWLTGSFLAVRREVVETVGEMDTRFFLYSEETDWCWRIRSAGWDVRHIPVMRIVHHHSESTKPELIAQLAYSKRLFAEKHFSTPHRTAFGLAMVLRHGLRVALLAALPRRDPVAVRRLDAERRALSVSLGRAVPALGDPARSS